MNFGNPSKYRAVRTGKYASKREAARAAELAVLLRAGIITELREQVAYTLLPAATEWGFPRPVKYIADFVYYYGKKEIIEDVKGFRTEVFKLKKRMMRQILG